MVSGIGEFRIEWSSWLVQVDAFSLNYVVQKRFKKLLSMLGAHLNGTMRLFDRELKSAV